MSLWRWDSSIISLHHNVREELLKFILWQWFGEEIANIPLAFDMFHKKNSSRLTRSRIQKKRTSMLFDLLALIVSVANPSATVLSTEMVVGHCGYPSSINALD